jgi:hypothetical protein
VHLPQLQKKSSYLVYFVFSFILFFIDFFIAFFGRFVARGVQKRDKTFFRKNPSGLITKNAAFPPSVPPLPRLFCSIFFLSRFWAVRNEKSSKTRQKQIAGIFPQPPKKYLLTSLFFPPTPLE